MSVFSRLIEKYTPPGVSLGGLHSGVAGALNAARVLATSRGVAAAAAAEAARRRNMVMPEVHLQRDGTGTVTRAQANPGDRPRALNEEDMPTRDSDDEDDKAQEIIDIVNYLEPANEDHDRYAATGSRTFCNVYAYDFCYLCNVYMPRVWWTNAAMERIRDGEEVSARYRTTVRELNANSLHDWFEDYGSDYGWQEADDLDELQEAANSGEICIIVGKKEANADGSRDNGHIAAVVPEHDDHEAERDDDDNVTQPLISQAGSSNVDFGMPPARNWWLGNSFESYGFWRHE